MAKEVKTHTTSEKEEAQAEAFINGMIVTYMLVEDALEELKKSLDNVQAVFYIGNVVGKRTETVEQLQLAWDALTHLQDVVQDKYDTELDKHKAILRRHEYDELRDELGL